MDLVKLSASRIKTLLTCSWVYYCRYVLKLPDTSNDGAKRGTVTHLVLECLLKDNKKRKDYVAEILKNNTCLTNKSILRLIKKTAKAIDLNIQIDAPNLYLIDSFVVCGLNNDFYCVGSERLTSEESFDIENKNPRYRIGGFIDKTAYYDKSIKIVDYKTSASKFTGKDKTFNIQAMMYILAKKLHHEDMQVSADFQFLKFPKNPSILYKDDFDIRGFELYLQYLSGYMFSFNAKRAVANLANESAETRWLCGARKGDIKADGSPKFVCQYKYPFDYFVVLDGSGGHVGSFFSAEEAEKCLLSNPGSTIFESTYAGCPAFKGKLF